MQIYFKLDSKNKCVSKLNTVLDAVQTWMVKRKLNLIIDKTNIITVGLPLKMRNNGLPSKLRLEQTD